MGSIVHAHISRVIYVTTDAHVSRVIYVTTSAFFMGLIVHVPVGSLSKSVFTE